MRTCTIPLAFLLILLLLSSLQCNPTQPLASSPSPSVVQPDIQGTLYAIQQTQTALVVVSPIPSITPSPIPTSTPPLLGTLLIKTTPRIPPEVTSLFQSSVTPNPDAIFSSLTFSQGINPSTYEPLNPAQTFQNPVGHLYALFTYDGMVPDSQWTALWFYNGRLVYYETKPWDGGTGGYGYTDWNPNPLEWKPGEYEVQIFVGQEWKVSGKFTVEGEPSIALLTATTGIPITPSPSSTPTVTYTPSRVPTLTATFTASATTILPSRTPTRTPTILPPTASPTFTASLIPESRTPTSTPLPLISPTPQATPTPSATVTARPSPTSVIPSPTPSPTLIKTSTPTSPPTRTPTVTPTKRPTITPTTITPTMTRRPTATPVTPTPTYTRRPTLTTAP